LPRRPFRHTGFEDIESFVGTPCLRGWRQLEHVVAVIIAHRRLDPFTLVVGKVGERHGAAERLRFGYDRARDLALVGASRPPAASSRKVLARSGLRKICPATGGFRSM